MLQVARQVLGPSRGRRLRTVLSSIKLVHWLRLVWCLTVLWCEFGAFHLSLTSCQWPDNALSVQQSLSSTHVLLIADPQIRFTPSSQRTWTSVLRQFFYNLTLRKNWHFASRLHPDIVIFLGDMAAAGRLSRTEQDFQAYVQKFRGIFRMNSAVPVYFIPGSIDTGLNLDPAYSTQLRRWYFNHFGRANRQIPVQNTTFVLLDATSLVEEDYQRAWNGMDYDQWPSSEGGVLQFVRALGEESRTGPLILFTHIPLYRPDSASCGSLREAGTISRGTGPGYQNMLGKKTTNFLLETLRPSLVFSADDRDYCEYTHVVPSRFADDAGERQGLIDIREITVKSFSPASDIRWPGFHLLSIPPPPSSTPQSSASSASQLFLHTYSDRPCLLPNYLGVYTRLYLPLVIISALVLFLEKLRTRRGPTLPVSLDLHSSSSSPMSSASSGTFPWHMHLPAAPEPESMVSTSKQDTSPRGTLPITLRTPLIDSSGADTSTIAREGCTRGAPMFRASTRAGTPLLSALPSPFISANMQLPVPEDEAFVYRPRSYASGPVPTPFGTPSSSKRRCRLFPREWRLGSFVGRDKLLSLPDIFRPLTLTRRKDIAMRRARPGALTAVAVDLCSVAWPAVILWCILAWRVLQAE
ncbi:hypothetical protein AcV5_003567 [Taiwanofungus camphoratus]|nr:hypothetical protein AcV5_003567 [Antrodia cinnamomea]